jgi:type II secretory pathway component GspD/PulD (secretin)
MKRIMEIVAKLDVPRRQVVLEVLVVDLWEDASDEFGFNWEFVDHDSSVAMSSIGSFAGVASFTSVPTSKLVELALTLKALITEKRARIRSRPRVATLNGQKASIDISLDEYFAIITDLYSDTARLRTELQIIKSGVKLEMTPHIGDNGDITIDVHTVVSDVASRRNNTINNGSVTDGDLPVIRRREATTRVRAKEGDAVVIGGLVETQERTDDKSVPLLSSIPLVGGLFTSKENRTVKKEVMIFITPRLIREGQIALSDRHKLINETEEIEKLRDVDRLFDVRYLHRHDSTAAQKEIEALRDVITLLDGQKQPHKNAFDKNSEGEITTSGHQNLRNVAEKIETLQEVVALLDVQHQPRHNSLNADKEHESSVNNE